MGAFVGWTEDALSQTLAAAKQANQKGDYQRSLDLNQSVIEHSDPGSLQHALGWRFVGLCHYRLDEFEASEKALRRARALADQFDDGLWLSLRIANHLGATLRRMGRPDEALELFRSALQQAQGDKLREERARLLGNLGALYDEAGQRAWADDAYARYEELCQLLDDAHRLANARGLVARAERLRGNLEEAKWRVEEAERLAGDDDQRLCHAEKHRADLELAYAEKCENETEKRQHLETAEAFYERALTHGSSRSAHVRSSFRRGRARVLALQGKTPAALAILRELLSEYPDEPQHVESRAEVLKLMAELAAKLWLHGEALHFLEAAIRTRMEHLESLPRSALAMSLFKPRFAELRELGRTICETAQAVPRSDEERQRVERLLGEQGVAWAVPTLDSSLRAKAQAFWRDHLVNKIFDQLSPASQHDLALAEVVYHGAVDDLGRSAHLLVIVFERELRTRFLEPVVTLSQSQAWNWNDELRRRLNATKTKLGLSDQLALLKLALAGKDDAPDFLAELGRRCRAAQDAWRRVAGFDADLRAADGTAVKPIAVRNAIAHGREELSAPTRLQVDALRHTLLLSEQSPLAALMTVDLREV